MTHKTLSAALVLAGLGYQVFPCREDKAPACPHGFKDASGDPKRVRALWHEYHGPLVGIATGGASNLAVLDLDAKHAQARDWWREYRDRMPRTYTARTRSGGLHLYFRHRVGLRCSVANIAPGVDVRAEGGYLIAWPAAGLPVLQDVPLASWPDWLAAQLSSAPAPRHEGIALPIIHGDGNASRRYALAALRNAVVRLASAQEGSRNDALNAETFGLMRFAPDSLTPQEIADAMAIAARHAGLLETETQATLASALRAGGAR